MNICGVYDNQALLFVQKLLPEGYDYHICWIHKINKSYHFDARIRIAIKTKNDVLKWRHHFEGFTGTRYKTLKTFPQSGLKNDFKIVFSCHNKQVGDVCFNKNVCSSILSITLKRVLTERKSRSKDLHLPDFPCIVDMKFGHGTICCSALSRLSYSPPDIQYPKLEISSLDMDPTDMGCYKNIFGGNNDVSDLSPHNNFTEGLSKDLGVPNINYQETGCVDDTSIISSIEQNELREMLSDIWNDNEPNESLNDDTNKDNSPYGEFNLGNLANINFGLECVKGATNGLSLFDTFDSILAISNPDTIYM